MTVPVEHRRVLRYDLKAIDQEEKKKLLDFMRRLGILDSNYSGTLNLHCIGGIVMQVEKTVKL